MKFSYLIRRKRKRYINENKEDKSLEETGSSGFIKSQSSHLEPLDKVELIPIESGLTKSNGDAKIKKDKLVYGIDQSGNIAKIPTYKLKQKIKYQQKILDISNFGIGYYIIAPIILGVFLGLGLDSWFETKPYFFIFFLIFGTASSFYNLFKLLKDERKPTHKH